jgi:threonine 3-dehydrogenase
MLAARFAGDGRVVVEDRAVPEPGPGEVLIDVDSCALCGSDREAWTNGSEVTAGHEISGTIAALGDGVDAPEPGTPGVVFLVDPCEDCVACRAGSPNMCLAKRAMYGFTAPGGFAEYVTVRAACFLPVDPAIPLDAATALLDLFGTTAHAFRRAKRPGAESVAVVGCGPIGLGAIVVARALGVPTVVGVDVSPYRLKLAEVVGAFAVSGTEDGKEATRRLAAEGFDVVIEAAGLPGTQRRAIEMAAPGGVVVLVAHSSQPLELMTSRDLVLRERALVGSEYFRPHEFAENHERMRSGELDPAAIITHRFPLELMEQACEAFFKGETGKVLIRP